MKSLQVGERRLPTGQTETLIQRLQFILDFLEDEDIQPLNPELESTSEELKSLIKDVKKYETHARKRLGPKASAVAGPRKSKVRRNTSSER